MSGLTYTTKKGTEYSFNDKGVTKEGQPLKRAIYISVDEANKIIRLCRGQETTPGDMVFERGHFSEQGGVIFYETNEGKYLFSSAVETRNPEFQKKSLDEKLEGLEQ